MGPGCSIPPRAGFLLFLLFSSLHPLAAGPVSWGATANVAPGGWGRMVPLTNGTWLAVSTVFPSGTNTYLSLLISSNSCRNWTSISQVNEAGRTLDNGELVALPNGAVLLTMRSLIAGTSYHLPVYQSTDGGRSWRYLSNIDSSNGPGGLWEPDFLQLQDGSLAVFYSNETHSNYSQIVSERISSDNGATWGREIWAVCPPGGGALRPGMPQVARMVNGRYILVYEVVGINNADVYFKTSDDGFTWPTGLGTHIPCQHAGPFVVSVPDGQVFVTSCENQVSFSRDFGASWQRIDPPAWNLGFNLSWPALYNIGPAELGAMVTWGGVKLRFAYLLPAVPWPNPYRDTFDDNPDSAWTHYGGSFAVTNGQYCLNDVGSYGKSLVGSEFWSDGTLEADVMLRTPGNAGLVFRATNPDYTGPDDGFDYYVGLDTGGFLILGKQNNAWVPLSTSPASIITNVWYHLKINLQGNALQVYLGDMTVPKLVLNDSSFARGQVGVRAFQCNAAFDNVTFANTAPPRLNLEKQTDGLLLSWPPAGIDVKVYQAASLGSAAGAGSPLPSLPVLSNGQSTLFLPDTAASAQYFWLQGQ